MKTNTSDTGSKDWNEVDPRVLGQILAAQNLDFVLPDSIHIAEFYAETVSTVPGVDACRVCLDGVSLQKGEMNSEMCKTCWATRKKTAGQDAVSPSLSDTDFSCKLGEQPAMQLVDLRSQYHRFGFFILQVSDLNVFRVYSPFIRNLANYVALSLENRLQRELLQKSQVELERKVEERTRDLEVANTKLHEEVEIKRRVEEALEREQTLLSRIMETSPVGITLVDREGQITFANSQAEKVLGLTRNEITQRTYNAPAWHITTYDGDPFPDEDLPFQRVISTGTPVYDIQHMIAWPDGNRLFLSINGAPIRNEKGDIDSIVFTIEDITERKQAEEALIKSEQKLRTVFNTVEEALTLNELVFNENGEIVDYRILEANLAFERITSLPNGQAIGKYATELYGMSPEYIKSFWKEHMHDEHAVKTDMYVEQIQAWQHISTSIPVQNQFVTSFFDITDLKNTESALRESERKFRSFVEESSEGFTQLDEQGRIIEWNRARERMTGLKADQVTGRFLWDVMHQIMPPERRTSESYERNKKIILDALKTGQSPILNHQIEAEVMTQDGKRRFVRQTVFPIKTEKGYRIGSVTSDITERKHAEDELRQNREAALQFSEQLTALQEITNGLSKAKSSDDLYMLAVQLGRSRLGFDRVSIWFIEEHPGIMRGSFGTDEHGELRDERDAQVEFRQEGLAWRLYSHKEPMALVEQCLLYDHLGREVGEGENALAALWDGDEVIGVVCVDNLFTGQPIREHKLEILRLYAATLGHLITRKRAEEARRASEERLQLALEAADLGLWEWNIVTGETMWSPQCLALYGLPPETPMCYEKFLQILYPEDREHVDSALKYAVEKLTSYDEMKRVIWPDGSIHWTASRGQVYCDASGEPVRMVGVTFDISRWKEAEAQLLASEQLFRALVENSPDFIARYDLENRRIYVNPAIQKLFASSAENVLGKTPADQSPIYAPPLYIEHLQQAVKNASESILETPFRTAQGEMHWGQIRFVPEFGSDGKVASVLAIGRDVHDIKENERHFRMLAENFPDFVMRFTRDGQYTYVNPAFEKAFDVLAEIVVDKTLHELPRHGDPGQNDVLLALIQRTFDEGISNEFEVHWGTNTGERIFEIRYAPEKDATGNVVSVLCIARDITERKQAEQALRESEERLRQIASSLREVIWLRDAQTRQVLYVNPAFEELTGRTCESFYENRDIVIDAIHPDDKEGVIEALEQRYEGIPYDKEHRIVRLDSNVRWVSSRIFPVRNEAGEVYRWTAIMEDITERKQMEDVLAAREREFRTLAENSPDNIARYDANCLTLYVNPTLERTLGSPASEMLGTSPEEAALIDDAQQYQEKIAEVFKTGKDYEMDIVLPDRGEGVRYHNIRFVAERGADGAITGVQTIGRDITERKQAEIERQAHLQFLESMDQINRAIQGTNDLEQMMSDVLDIVLSIFNCDRAFLMYPCDPDALSWFSPMERTRPEYPGILALEMDEMPMDAEVAKTLRILLEADGPVKFGPETSNVLPADVSERYDIKSFMSMALYPKVGKPWQFGVHQCSFARIWIPEEERLFQEVGRRLSDALSTMLTHRNLRESEERYRQLVDVSPDGIIVYSQGRIAFVNPAAVRLSGIKSEEYLVGKSILEFVQSDYRENVKMGLEQIQRTGESVLFVEENFLRVDGKKLDVEVAIVPYQFQGDDYIQILVRDITERKQHERERELIITVSTALRQAVTRTEILNVILDQLIDLFDADGAVLVLPDPQTGGLVDEMGRGVVGERMVGLNIPSGEGVCDWVITNKKPYLSNQADQDALFYRPDLLGKSHCLISVPLIAQDQVTGALWVARQLDFVEQDLRLLTAIADIAANAIHRITLHEQTEQQLHRLIALHQIDLAISTNIDLNITLNVILGSVKEELDVDAVSILLLNPITHTLDYTAGIGFRTHNIEQSHVRLGSGCAGRAAQELRTISGLDIGEGSGIFVRSSLLASEEFMSHYATPLVVKGQIKGVLEVFHRKPLAPEHTWFSYFETLATQSVIAIENASLFENLQRSNMELTLAYDATIEGWSRALDLRDRETEGHTQRVAEMALALADKMGMNDAEKLNLWRGALLHDIGKVGIPDAILLKPGPLSDDEWEIMRQHPLYAYQMLSPIKYLKHALEVPYCHHEKWDGSGYPRGLKGDEIPLSARVFAVVDVFDALISERPYSKSWSLEQAYQYIQEQAGMHFDPAVAKAFLESR